MRNVFKVFISDARRLSTNVVAIVIIMGLTIVPVLYAWFNIMSNWDPYGPDATSQMHIAVYSEDEGFSYGNLKINIGDTVVEGLEANSTIGWIFTETKEEALKGVYNGECYAAFVIQKDFTEKMLSFISGDIENPKISYYENSKKNAIATKITSKVKTTVQNQVNTSIVTTLTEMASKSGEVVTGDESAKALDSIVSKLKEMDHNLNTYVSILNSLSLLTDSTNDLVGSTQALLPSAEGIISGSQGTVSSMQDTVLTGAETANTISQMVDISMESISSGLDNLSAQIAVLKFGADYASINKSFQMVDEMAQSTLDVLKGFENINSLDSYKRVVSEFEALSDDIDTFTKDEEKSEEKLKALKKTIEKEIKSCKNAVNKLKTTFDYQIAPSLSKSVYSVESALIMTQTMLSNLDSDFPEVDRALQSYRETLKHGTANIEDAKEYVLEVKKGLKKVIKGISGLSENEKYQELLDILKSDPTLLAEFVASPIAMETEAIYEISTYGSAMAPFYTVLAIWVGGLIMVALIHVKVEDCEELEGVKFWQKYFGRYITFFLVGQASTLICVFGDLFYIGIQCLDPFKFWLASAVTSFVFTFFMYSLTVAMGNVGQAVAVVVMVIQVAGAGGTFPVEVLPEVYQAVYRFLPFTYAMNALRECVGGMYHMDYWYDLGILGIYLLISLFIGLVLTIPFRPLLELMEKSKKKSGVMM